MTPTEANGQNLAAAGGAAGPPQALKAKDVRDRGGYELPESVSFRNIRFANPTMESDYVNYAYNSGLGLPAVMNFVVLAIILVVTFTQLSLKNDPEAAINLAMAVCSLTTGIVATVCWRLQKFCTPVALERWWLLTSFWYASSIASNNYSRLLIVCRSALSSSTFKPTRHPGNCDELIDGNQCLGVFMLFVGTPRTVWMIPFFLYIILVNFVVRWAIYGVSIKPFDYFFALMMVLVALTLHGVEQSTRTRFVQSIVLRRQLRFTLRTRDSVNRMLEAIVAPSIVRRLAAGEEINDRCAATVLFSDIAGFTAWSSKHRAIDVVRMLNVMYRLFDRRLESIGVEKITTIGDAYWACSGMPTQIPFHAQRVCLFALHMQRFVGEMHRVAAQYADVRIRIGINTGDFTGGIIGRKQLAYQVFGPEVDTAQHCEEHAPVGGILITETTLAYIAESTPNEVPDVTEGHELIDGKKAYVLQAMTWRPDDYADEQDASFVELAVAEPQRSNRFSETSRSIVSLTGRSQFTDRNASASEHKTTERTARKLFLQNRREVVHTTADAAADGLSDAETSVSAADYDLGDEGDVTTLKTRLLRRKYRFGFLDFVDEEMEQEYKPFIRGYFGYAMRRTLMVVAAFTFALLIACASEANPDQKVGVYIIYALVVLACAVVAGFSPMLPTVVIALMFHGSGWLLYAAAGIALPSIVSSEIGYVLILWELLIITSGNSGVSWIMQLGVNAVSIYASYATTTLIVNRPRLSVTFFLPQLAGACALWVAGHRRYELGTRVEFVERHVSVVAERLAKREEGYASDLLSRTVPRFVLPELLTWLSKDVRTHIIAHRYHDVGVLFCKVPALKKQGYGDEEFFARVAHVVSLYDDVLTKFPACTKIKAIGDMVLVTVGFEGQLTAAVEEAAADSSALAPQTAPSSAYGSKATKEALSGALICELLVAGCHLHDQVVKETGLRPSVGMFVGPLVGGVLGDDRLIYDVFGDTVNTASRVMSTSGEGVWTATSVAARVADAFPMLSFGPACVRQMKGKGEFQVCEVLLLASAQ